jgi:hypothetical protein
VQTYSLHLLIDPEDLHAIQARHLNIVLAKPVNEPQLPNVIWQSFAPRTDNVVTWTEMYGIYVAKPPLVHGMQIVPPRFLPYPACGASAYTFAPDTTFHGPYYGGGMLGPDQFCIANDVPPVHYSSLIFGMAQTAIINGLPSRLSPLNAEPVPSFHRALFTPGNTVYIWLQAGVTSGTVNTHLSDAVTTINVGRFRHPQSLKYDATQGRFVPYSYVKRASVFTMPNMTWPGSVRQLPPTP